MNKCKTCEWHKVPKNPTDDNESTNGGDCCCPKIYEVSEEPGREEGYSKDHFVYSYSEGGWFWTGFEFGCIHHEEKSDE